MVMEEGEGGGDGGKEEVVREETEVRGRSRRGR